MKTNRSGLSSFSFIYSLFFLHASAVIWIKYYRYDVKYFIINQSVFETEKTLPILGDFLSRITLIWTILHSHILCIFSPYGI